MNLKEQYRRFRTWQKTPALHWNYEGEGHHCPNCGHEYAGNYCPVCGQQADDGRITWRWVWKSILDVWGMDSRSLPYTLLQLLLRPGYLISDYISGHRQTCYKPVNMLFIVAIFYVIISQFLVHGDSGIALSTLNESNILDKVLTWLLSHPAWTALSMTMILILPTHILFRFAPRHTRHTLPESIFIQLFMSTLMLICTLASKLIDQLFWLIPFYYYFTYRQFFGYRPWGTIWRLLLCAIVWFILLCTIIITPMLLFDTTKSSLGGDAEFTFDTSVFNLGNDTAFLFSLVVIGIFLLLAAIPLAFGYWISKKTAPSQTTDIQ